MVNAGDWFKHFDVGAPYPTQDMQRLKLWNWQLMWGKFIFLSYLIDESRSGTTSLVFLGLGKTSIFLVEFPLSVQGCKVGSLPGPVSFDDSPS